MSSLFTVESNIYPSLNQAADETLLIAAPADFERTQWMKEQIIISDEPLLAGHTVCAPTVPEAYELDREGLMSGLVRAKRALLVGSAALENTAGSHWDAIVDIWGKDPAGEQRSLIPVLFENYRLGGLLAPLVAIDLSGLGPVQASQHFIERFADSMPGADPRRHIQSPPPFWDNKS